MALGSSSETATAALQYQRDEVAHREDVGICPRLDAGNVLSIYNNDASETGVDAEREERRADGEADDVNVKGILKNCQSSDTTVGDF